MNRVAVLVPLLVLLVVGSPASAQLISPGKLNAAHADLDGIRRCTSCHTLGRPGISPERCLTCHDVLQQRVAAGQGYHARPEAAQCASCHREHYGRDFDLVRFDTASFDHREAGYALEGAHTAATCGACHAPERIRDTAVRAYGAKHGALDRTMLGLDPTCAGCHVSEDPHGAQFQGRECSECHDAEGWDSGRAIDHAETAFPLAGEHRRVTCEGCHAKAVVEGRAAVRYAPIPSASCTDCHDDAHDGVMTTRCESCHTTAGWSRVERSAVERRFDHDRTGFPLVGAHGEARCGACHDPTDRRTPGLHIRFVRGTTTAAYPRPVIDGCVGCHTDVHGGGLADPAGSAACESCHTQDAWTPGGYDIERHNRGASFVLAGAHLAVPCGDCHRTADRLRLTGVPSDCVACHRKVDPHAGRFGSEPCASCHTSDDWRVRTFDHSALPADAACGECHATDDPHAGQFGARTCRECHGTDTFRIDAFDHGRARFPLDGAHIRAACSACHTADGGSGQAIRYRPIAVECRACHGGVS